MIRILLAYRTIPEAVEAGTIKLVGTDKQKIVHEIIRLIEGPENYLSMAKTHNPYGDGMAVTRIVGFLKHVLIKKAN